MFRLVLATGVAFAAAMASSLAADLPSQIAEPTFEPSPPIPVFTWTGFYAGVHAGYEFGRDTGFAATPLVAYGDSPSGMMGGGHFGYNYSTPTVLGGSPVVVGLEGDIDGADYARGATLAGAFVGDTLSTTSDIKGSIRGRLGISVNRVLFYATGGAAFADMTTQVDGTANLGGIDTFHRARAGYTIGGGVEYAFMNNYSIRAEYRYSNYGRFTDTLVASVPGATLTHRESDSRVQAGISYKFDSIVPSSVTAKY